MSQTQDQSSSKFYPYGTHGGLKDADIGHENKLGAAQVCVGEGIVQAETYTLEAAGEYWRLWSSLGAEPRRLLASVPRQRVGNNPADVGLEILLDVWALRVAPRLNLLGCLDSGVLGAARWGILIAAGPGKTSGGKADHESSLPLEQLLRHEGHAIKTIEGPVGTTEYLLLFSRAR